MPDRDGYITDAESRALEAQAEALLKEDAKQRGYIRANGRGFSEFARAIGITTKKTLETTFKHEKVGFTEQQLESLADGRGMVNVVEAAHNIDDRSNKES